MHLRLDKSLYLIVFITVVALSLAACSKTYDGGLTNSDYESLPIFSDGRPSIGPMVEDETVTNVDIVSQTRISVTIHSGSIKVTRTDQDQLQIIEKWRLRGPTSQEHLSELLEKSKKAPESTSMSINIEREATSEALYRQTVQMELKVPESIKQIDIDAENASIVLSGFNEMLTMDLTIGRGTVHADQCSSKRIDVSVEEGNIYMKDISGFGTYECVRGDILLKGVTGSIDLKSFSGNTVIEEARGKLNCYISTGSLTVKNSAIEKDSMLYATHGNILADFEKIGIAGGCRIMAAKGDIRVKLPDNNLSWALAAKTTKGRIKNKMNPKPEWLESVSPREAHGNAQGEGPLIDIYVDNGDIFLE